MARELRAARVAGRDRACGRRAARRSGRRGRALSAAWRGLARDRALLLELFVVSNLAFLVLDVFLAHSINAFRHPAEWIPVGYAALGAVALGVNLALRGPWRARAGRADWRQGAGRALGLGVGLAGIVVGIAGLLWHLESGFFRQTTLRSLVYSAPFAAPLAFAGLGFLALLGRLAPASHPDWGRWVLLLAWGGFVGCLALALGDHAQNGFFRPAEWIAVAAAAIAVAFLAVPLAVRVPGPYLTTLLGILALEAAVGVLGFALHVLPAFEGGAAPLADRVLYGAPPFAPLLFSDLAFLAALGTWAMRGEGTA